MLPIITALMPLVGEVLDRVIPDKAAAEKAKLELTTKIIDATNQGAIAQIETNKVEAAHQSVFVSGWRPAVGWVCASGLGWAFVGQPVANWALVAFNLKVTTLPVLPTENLMELVMAMLGLGALRSFEKFKGLTK